MSGKKDPNTVQFSKDYVTVHVGDKESKPSKKAKKRPYIYRALSISSNYQSKKKLIYDDKLIAAVAIGEYEKCSKLLETDNYRDLEKLNDCYSFHPLLIAAQKGYSQILQLLLDHNAYINITDDKKCTAIHLAAQQGSIECCRILLEQNIALNVTDKYGNYPIHAAANEGLDEVVKWFLDRHVDPNVKNKKDETPVHLAASKGHHGVLSLLLDNTTKQGRWDVKDHRHKVPLHDAAYNGHAECCRLLIKYSGEEKDCHLLKKEKENKCTPLILAAKKGHARCCEELIDSKINEVDINGNTALHHAVKIGFNRTVNILLKMKADIHIKNNDQNKAIHIAASFATDRHRECVQSLFEYSDKNDPGHNDAGQNILAIAAINNCTETLSYILMQDIFIMPHQINNQDNNSKKTALHLAIDASNVEACKSILEVNTVDCYIADSKLNLPLHLAANQGLTVICKILLQSKRSSKSINAKNKDGVTPLHYAASYGSMQCCNLLLQKNANLNSKDKDGYSPFHLAAVQGNIQILKIFLGKGQMNQVHDTVEFTGDNPLHLAAENGRTDCVEFLLNKVKKSYIMTCNKKGNSYLDLAFDMKHDNTFKMIISKWPHWKNVHEQFNESYLHFKKNLHRFMHISISDNRRIIQDAIIESRWWYSGFTSDNCEKGVCPNLRDLVQTNPEAAENVFDKCVEKQVGKNIYNFKIFEDKFYTSPDPKYPQEIRSSAFDEKTNKLKEHCELEHFSRHTPHLLSVAIDYRRINLLQHEVTQSFLKSKWNSYISCILYFLLLFEIFVVTLIAFFLYNVRNWDQLFLEYKNSTILNITDLYYESCSLELSDEIDPNGYIAPFVFTLRILLFIVSIIIISFESHIVAKLRFRSLNSVFIVKALRLIGIIVMIAPSNFCQYYINITTETCQWQIGIVTILVSWYHMIHSLNEIPKFSVFMPITLKFFKSFMKVFSFILLILFIYVFIFFLLFRTSNPAFENLWRSFIKSTVWILGDLAYDDMFLSDDHPLVYPIFSNIIFLTFVTTISGFIVNLVITQPEKHLDSFKNDAAFYKIASRIRTMIKYDNVFSDLYMTRAISKLEENVDLGYTISKNKIAFLNLWKKDRPAIVQDSEKDYTNEDIVNELAELKSLVAKLVQKVGDVDSE